jgi:lambda family phage portal protein
MNPFNCVIGRQTPASVHGSRIVIQPRQYAAAKTTRLTGDWMPAVQDVNSVIRSSAGVIRSRLRQLVRDFPYFVKAKKNLVNYTVGADGISFQSRVLDTANLRKDGRPTINKVLSQQIEDAVKWGMDEIDARWYPGSSEAQFFGEFERLVKSEDVEAGESLLVKTFIKDPQRYLPYSLMAYESEWLTSLYADVAKGMVVDQGKEFDPKTGRTVAYHFAVPSGYGAYNISATTKPVRIPAEYVLHGFETLRPGQLRGVSPFVTAILLAHDLSDYMDATIDVAKMAARYLGIIESADIAGFQRSRTVDGQGADQGKKLENIEGAIFEYLRPGEKMTFAPQNIPGDQVGPFSMLITRMLAIATDTTYELLSGDYAGLNFSNLKGIRNDFAVMMRPHQARHVNHCTRPVVNDLIETAVLTGKLKLPGYWDNPRIYQRALYLPPGMESVDMLRDTKALLDQMKSGLRDPQEIAAARGKDLDDILDNIQEFAEDLKARGLDFILDNVSGLSTAVANNPAAVDPDTDDSAETADNGDKGKKKRALNLTRVIKDAVEEAFLLAESEEK